MAGSLRSDRDLHLRCGRFIGGLAWGPAGDLSDTLLGTSARYAPDRPFDSTHVRLDLTLDFGRRAAFGTCLTTIRALQDNIRKLSFDAVDLKISSVLVGGRKQAFITKNEKLLITLRRPLAHDEETQVLVRYRVARPRSGLHFVYPGPHNRKNPVQVWSQSQPEDARYWFPCHDSPHEKVTSEIRVTLPRGFKAVSNGELVEETVSGKNQVFHWRMNYPHSIYLISLAAGKFSVIREKWENIPVTYYCEKGREADARRGFAKTPKAIEFFSRITGVRYPYEKYSQVAAAEFPGGMENTTATTQTDSILIDRRAYLDNDLDLLVAHELAHQWFGNLVTCRDWSHAWLNEGFATYCEVLFSEYDKGLDEAQQELLDNAQAYFDEDARRYRRAIVTTKFKLPWTLFDRHLYEKACWVLFMLHHELGDGLWWKAVRYYLNKHRHRSVDTFDFITAIEEATGRNLRAFFNQWVFRTGYPVFKLRYSWRPKDRRAKLRVLQTQPIADDQPAFSLPVLIRFSGPGWTREFTEKINSKEHLLSFQLPGEPLNVEFDPGHKILKKASITKPLSMWRRQLSQARSAWSRHEAAEPIARWGTRDCVDILVRAIRREKFWGAAGEMVRNLGTIRSEAAYEALAGLAAYPHPKVRRAVVEALAGWRRPESAPLLRRLALRDPSVHVAAQALRALGALDDPRHLALLSDGLKKPSHRDILRAGALAGFAATRSRRALPVLKKAARPPYGYFARVQAIRSLAGFSNVSNEVVPFLCRLSKDPDERITLAIVATLGMLEDDRAVPTLEEARKSPNSRIKVFAEEALAKIFSGSAKKHRE